MARRIDKKGMAIGMNELIIIAVALISLLTILAFLGVLPLNKIGEGIVNGVKGLFHIA